MCSMVYILFYQSMCNLQHSMSHAPEISPYVDSSLVQHNVIKDILQDIQAFRTRNPNDSMLHICVTTTLWIAENEANCYC